MSFFYLSKSTMLRFIFLIFASPFTGISDLTSDRVALLSLRSAGVSLTGQLPVGALGNLTKLQTLSLRFNALSGILPSDLASCKDLRNLYLQGNHFSGSLPEFLFSLHNLVRLNVAGNNFTGEISSDFNNLVRLRTLYLENNHLTGSIPDFNNSLCGGPLKSYPTDGTAPAFAVVLSLIDFLSPDPFSSFVSNSILTV